MKLNKKDKAKIIETYSNALSIELELCKKYAELSDTRLGGGWDRATEEDIRKLNYNSGIQDGITSILHARGYYIDYDIKDSKVSNVKIKKFGKE